MKQCDVIVTYCWNRVGYNIVRSLASHGLRVWVADTSKKNICSMSNYCSGSFVYPDPFTDEDGFINCLLEKIEELKPSVLMPTHDESVVIMRHRSCFPADLKIPYMNEKALLSLANKRESTEMAASVGIPTPEIYRSIEDVRSYPVVYKTTIGNSAKGVFFPKCKKDLIDIINKTGRESLLEEFVSGTDYSVDCIRWGNFWKASVYHALVTKTEGGGTTTQRETIDIPIIEDYARRFLDNANFYGVCGLDFRYDPVRGKIAYIETNARFTGGLATQISAGFDIPWVLYKLVTEGHYDDHIDVKPGVKTKWILGDIITIVSRVLSFRWNSAEMRMALNFKGFEAFDDFYPDDRLAILGEFGYYLGKLLKYKKLNP